MDSGSVPKSLTASALWIVGLAGCASFSPGPLGGSRMIHVSGGSLEVSANGEGSPAVVFESGAGAACRMGNWADVVAGLKGEARIFAYNRSGYGRSRIHRSLDDPRDVVETLRQALTAAGVDPPYLLVGHSLGGLYLNLFARLHPDEVSGLILVDSSHPDQFEDLRREKPLRHAALVAGYSTGSPHVRYEMANMGRFRLEVERAGPLPDIPIVVLTAGESPSWQGEQERAWWLALQAELAAISPRSRHRIIDSSGHFIQRDRPDVVIETIRELLAEVSR